MERLCLLKEREKKVLDSLENYSKVKDACQTLNMSPRTVYNILFRLRKRYVEARRFVNQMVTYRRKSKLLDKVLSVRTSVKEEKPLEELKPEEEEDWEEGEL
jgi:DNA-binding transcriptional ArsR family regulator